MSDMNYDSLFKKLIDLGGGQLSNFEQTALLIHSIFLMNEFTTEDNKLLDTDWNKDYGIAVFKYTLKKNGISISTTMTIKEESNNLIISVTSQKAGGGSTTNSITLNKTDDLNAIDYNDLAGSIKSLEKRLQDDCINSIKKLTEMNTNPNLYYSDPDVYDPIFSGEEFNPNKIRIGGSYDPFPNPYFSTGGGAVPGGNYVGPNSDIFSGNFPKPGQPQGGSKVRYDPIGPFGTFGGKPKSGGFPGDPFGKGPFGGPFI
jgi:hypothetical protein